MKEVSRALKSGDPENYVTNCHVHLDGSCNGMQHYAAFGRDSRGAQNVSLAPSDKPGDVYTAILHLVNKDIETEIDPKLIEIAQSLKGHTSRKVIKQTVMTSVYGVTFIGARKQIQKQLKDKECFETNGELYKASAYLAKITIKCIGDLFKDANKIKDWFSKSAKIVAQSNDPVKWTTPLGLSCVQPYKRLTNSNIIATVLQNLTVISSLDDQPVNKNKQNTAFPPNFVHSIDATHMMYTALK
jgi:DNA-directed RNA polymerase